MNRICLVGRITKDLELSYTSTKKAVCNFTIAVNRDKDNVDFIDVQVWNEQAENLKTYQSKGSMVGVEGSLRKDIYTGKDGNKASKTYVLANHIEYLSSKKEEETTKNPYEEFGEQVNINDSFLD